MTIGAPAEGWRFLVVFGLALAAAPARAQPSSEPPAAPPAQPGAPTPAAEAPAAPAEAPTTAPVTPEADAAAGDEPSAPEPPADDSAGEASGGEEAPTCEQGGPCEIEDLKTPASPAFTLIGVTPESIVKPSSPRELAVALYKGFGGETVPAGFSLEAAPYWLFKHADLTYDQYRDAGVGRQMVQNAGLSIASAEGRPAADGTSRVDLAVGLRTNVVLYSFHPSGKEMVDEATRAAEQKLLTLQEMRLLQSSLEAAQCQPDEQREPCKTARLRLEAARARLGGAVTPERITHEELAAVAEELQTALEARDGIALEAAWAAAWTSPTDHLTFRNFSRWGAWLTGGYEDEHWNLLGLGRYLRIDEPAVHFFDLGGRAGAVSGRYGFHLELLHRFVLDAPDDAMLEGSERIAGTLEVRIADSLYVSATFGEDADSEVGEGSVIALAGISFQAGSEHSVTQP